MLRIVLVLILAVLAGQTMTADITGTPRIIDGETLEVGGKQFRLAGIDAPDPRQTCFIRQREYR